MGQGPMQRRGGRAAPANQSGLPPLPMEARQALIHLIELAESWPALAPARPRVRNDPVNAPYWAYGWRT
jgi:hypothetical protein